MESVCFAPGISDTSPLSLCIRRRRRRRRPFSTSCASSLPDSSANILKELVSAIQAETTRNKQNLLVARREPRGCWASVIGSCRFSQDAYGWVSPLLARDKSNAHIQMQGRSWFLTVNTRHPPSHARPLGRNRQPTLRRNGTHARHCFYFRCGSYVLG